MTPGADREIVDWVSAQVLPLEGELRRWLRGVCRDSSEVDDLIQDIYYRLLKLSSVSHIGEPRAYLYQMARNIRIDQMRRQTVVRIDSVQNMEDLIAHDTSPSPEQVTVARAELKWVMGLIANLPERCKQVFELRKVHGLSQAETADNLHISENIVEKETARGLFLISAMIERVSATAVVPETRASPRKARKKARHVAP